ncbi:MAG: serine/threonine protein kinase [Clostridiales bacterium]|jgi:serine/threonine protein kinase|nr:serine/threonine protein kinase [Clostridiales bacterium]
MSNLESEYILSRFKEIRILSDEGRSKVYMVLDEASDRPFVKRLLPSDADTNVYKQLQANPPKNIPKIHHIIEDEAQICVIEEYISGTRLDEIIGNQGKSDTKQVIAWVLTLCDTLEQLHFANPPIIHRDIKPSNIIITDDGTPKLIDFDISRNYNSGGKSDTKALGTEYYAAPEQFGYAQTDARTDIYAVGKLMVTLLTGKQLAPDVPLNDCGTLTPIIKKCCDISPARRYQNVSELRKAIVQIKRNGLRIAIGAAACAAFVLLFFGLRHLLNPPSAENSYNQTAHEAVLEISGSNTNRGQDSDLPAELEPEKISDLTQEIEPEKASDSSQEIEPEQTSDSSTELEPEKASELPAVLEPNTSSNQNPVSPSLEHRPKITFGLHELVEETFNSGDLLYEDMDNLGEVIDGFENIDTKQMTGDNYEFFYKRMTEGGYYMSSKLTGNHFFFHYDKTGLDTSDAYFEMGFYGDVYIGVYNEGVLYYYTNLPEILSYYALTPRALELQRNELNSSYHWDWFNYNSGSSVVLNGEKSRLDNVEALYSNPKNGFELNFTQRENGLEYEIRSNEQTIKGTAEAKGDYYEAYIEDYGYMYFHFYDGYMLVFDKLTESARGNAQVYNGKYVTGALVQNSADEEDITYDYLPKPIFRLKETVESSNNNVISVLDSLSLTQTVKFLLGDKYEYFYENISNYGVSGYMDWDDSYIFSSQETENPDVLNAYLEINGKGEIYIGLYYNGASYFYTNEPDQKSDLHYNYLFTWFNLHGASPVILDGNTSKTANIQGFYYQEGINSELYITQVGDGLAYRIKTEENDISGAAMLKKDSFYEASIDGYGSLYFHFYDGYLYVFDKLIGDNIESLPDYTGKYEFKRIY